MVTYISILIHWSGIPQKSSVKLRTLTYPDQQTGASWMCSLSEWLSGWQKKDMTSCWGCTNETRRITLYIFIWIHVHIHKQEIHVSSVPKTSEFSWFHPILFAGVQLCFQPCLARAPLKFSSMPRKWLKEPTRQETFFQGLLLVNPYDTTMSYNIIKAQYLSMPWLIFNR